jgi:hypothetical protein
MTRAVSLATAGDPFTTSFVLKLFQERWYDEADAFYINFNNHCGVPDYVVSEFVSKAVKDKKVHLIYHGRGLGNGPPVAEIIHCCREDLIMLIEEDGFIFDSGAVNHEFQQIESDLVDAVGSPRFSCGLELGEAVAKKYKLDYSGYGDVGPNFWPNFFFCKTADLKRTDLDFGSHAWKPGTYEPLLDWTFKEWEGGDTFVWMGVQLRALGLRFGKVPQHHADPYELENKGKAEGNWHIINQPFHWIHGGSLSAGWGGYLTGRVPDTSTDISKREIETRVAFWKICMDETDGYEAFKVLYKEGIQSLIDNAHLQQGRIDDKINLYRKVMKL